MLILRKLLTWWISIVVTTVVAAVIAKFTVSKQDDPTAPRFALVSIFDGTDFRPTTQALTASKAVTMFGGTRIDLRRASTGPAPIYLDLVTVMGGTDITVPDNWRVDVEGTALMGGHDVHVADPETVGAEAPHLVIRARTLMGGVRIQARPVLVSASTG